MNSKIYGGIFLTLYVALVVVVFLFVELEPRPMAMQQNDVMYVEFIEPEIPPMPEPPQQEQSAVKPVPPVDNSNKQHESPHEQKTPEQHSEKTGGPAEENRTVNQKALFQMPKEGVDEPADVGNAAAKLDTVTTASGDNPQPGLSPKGTIEGKLDSGLSGRGCDYLPSPKYPPGNVYGAVVVRVTVNPEGMVETATFEPLGSTTNNAALIEAAKTAAKKAQFTKLNNDLAMMQGTITYYFRLKK